MLVKYLRALFSCFATRGASSGEQTIYGKRLSEVGVGGLEGVVHQDVDLTPQENGNQQLTAPFDCIAIVTRTSSYNDSSESHLGISRSVGIVSLVRSNYNVCVWCRLKKGEEFNIIWSGENVSITYCPT